MCKKKSSSRQTRVSTTSLYLWFRTQAAQRSLVPLHSASHFQSGPPSSPKIQSDNNKPDPKPCGLLFTKEINSKSSSLRTAKLIHNLVSVLATQLPHLPGAEVPLPLPRVQLHQHFPGIVLGSPANRVSWIISLAERNGAQSRVGLLDVARGDALQENLLVGGGVGEGELEARGGKL